MTVWNALRVRFAHIQRKNDFNFAILENLRIFQNCLFTGGVVEENGIKNNGTSADIPLH